MSQLPVVFKRELASYFATPLAYVFIVMFLVLSSVFTFYLGGFYARGQADLVDGALRRFIHLLLVQAGVEHDAAVGHRRKRERLHHADGDQLGLVQLGKGDGGVGGLIRQR